MKVIIFALVVCLIVLTGSIKDHKTEDMVFQASIALALCLLLLFGRRDKQSTDDFITWLKRNAVQLLDNKTLQYNNVDISLETVLVQYHFCFSFGFFSNRYPSRYWITEYHLTPLISLFYSAITVVFGWWSLPTGPFRAIYTIYKNATGGEKIRIRQLIPKVYYIAPSVKVKDTKSIEL
ncbi:hypothetical protein [Paenibacillus rigui]|uniref:Uncharacterized protein n=1 Tax=Paenibacillus rigui TaxID=554312 RepID=A0A229UQN6_9BACL|nr:hypothetical protein [Paenibacillus rigui]OXM85806.1 hypothetical protein CF651_11250 [Paenibacillus rigui]